MSDYGKWDGLRNYEAFSRRAEFHDEKISYHLIYVTAIVLDI